MVKLSIIVPIYGVEQYLRKCVDSLLAQDIPESEYEIILVNDGSPDACPVICDEYAKHYTLNITHGTPTIKVVHRENGGLSAARNSGIEVAQGEYVMFVDSDDYIEPNVLKGLLEQIKRDNLDVLRYDYRNVRMVNREYVVFQPYKIPHEVDRNHDVVDGITYMNERMGYRCYAWQFVIKKDIVSEFMPSIHFEDTEWLPRMMLMARRVGSAQTVVYNYFWREGSITLTQGNKDKMRRNIEDQMEIIEKYSAFIGDYPQCHWLRNMQSSMVSGVLTTIACELYEERKVYINRLKALNVFPLSIADQGKTYKRRAMITNLFGAEIYCKLMNLTR